MESDDIDFSEVEKTLDVDYEEGCDEVERFVPLKDFLEIDDENYYKY